MPGKKYQSCLAPFESEIITLRRKKPPVTFPKIAEFLEEKYQISVTRQAIEKYLKVRVKGFPICKYAWNIEPAQEVSFVESSKQAVSITQETLKQPAETEPAIEPFEMPFSETYNLTRLSDEEAAARNKAIEEKRKRLMEEKRKKENK